MYKPIKQSNRAKKTRRIPPNVLEAFQNTSHYMNVIGLFELDIVIDQSSNIIDRQCAKSHQLQNRKKESFYVCVSLKNKTVAKRYIKQHLILIIFLDC